ncbi:hypothetical protein SAMN05720354_10280 [Nitrosospira sp. Nsp1]|nr:hypothetical protein SAMN05720354_10280 [Nitrosospira sp. Nsp1]
MYLLEGVSSIFLKCGTASSRHSTFQTSIFESPVFTILLFSLDRAEHFDASFDPVYSSAPA